LREAKWSNAEPVTAQDFVYGWRRCLSPELAGEYAYQIFFVEGAEEFNSGKTTDPATIGVKALDDRTLQVHLKNPTPFFLSALAHYAYSPLKESWVTAHPQWTTTPGEYLCNGPFTLAAWKHNDELTMKKNPNYYNAAKVNLDAVVVTMITLDSTALAQFRAGKVDMTDNVPLPDIPMLKQTGEYNTNSYLGTYYVAFENKTKPFDDPRVRRAFALAINRRQISDAILRGDQKPAYAIVPPGISLEGARDFRDEGGELFREDVKEAKKLMTEAGFPDGRGFPTVKYIYNKLEQHEQIGQALQGMWQSALGVRVELDVQEWKIYQQNRQHHQFQLARAGWIGDYLDPVTFLDMFYSHAGNNDVEYQNHAFDQLLDQSKATTAPAERAKLLHDMEKKVIAEDMAVAPIYFYVNQFLQKPYVKGVTRNALGYIYFDKASVEGKP